jgi:type IV secretion system protein VirD4
MCAWLSLCAAAAQRARPPLPALTRDLFAFAAAAIAIAAIIAVARAWRSPAARRLLPLATRVRLRLAPGPGFTSSRLALRRRHGLPPARKAARRTRPGLSRAAVRRGPWHQYATFLGWAHGWLAPARVYGTFEQLLLVIAGPQKGKSGAAAGRILDAPGPVVATSIRGDLIAATAGLRQAAGQVHVFNPEGTGPYRSTFQWNPAAGCQDMSAAVRRAGYMIEAITTRGLEDSTFWQDQASMTLAAYLHAAGLAAGTLRDVYRWILDSSSQPLHILASHPAAAAPAASHLQHYLTLPDRTRSGVSTTLLGALRFLQVPEIASIVCPLPGRGLDLAGFLASRDVMYLVAADAAQSPVPPLFNALVAELAYLARQLGGAGPAGRLDPPLTLELDEAPNLTPLPIAAWATWAAGSGIRMHVCSQSFAQLAERWGPLGAETIWQACDVKLIHAGSSEEALSRKVSDACGEVRAGSRGGQAADQYRPALPFADLRTLPRGRAVVIRSGTGPVIVRTEEYWRRRDVRHFARRGGTPLLPSAPQARPAEPIPSLLSPPAPAPLEAAGSWPAASRALTTGDHDWPQPGAR